MRIILDIGPSANRYWRVVNGRIVRSREASDYKDYVALLCATMGMEPLDGNVRLAVDVYRPAKRGDLDNYLKVVGDALIGFAYHDDSQVVELRARRFDDPTCPRFEITVERIGAES